MSRNLTMIPRRVAILRVAPEFVWDLMQSRGGFRDTWKFVPNELPDDVKLWKAGFDVRSLTLVLYLSSSEFQEVPGGAEYPELQLQMCVTRGE